MPSQAKQPTTLLNQGIEVVRHLAHSGRSLGVTEIAKLMDMPKSSAFRILGVLVELGFVQKSDISGRYAMNPAIFSFVYDLTHHFGPSTRFDLLMRECTERWGCSVYISMLSGTHCYVVAAMGPSGGTLALGSHCPVYASSAGKIIASQFDEAEWAAYAPTKDETPITAYTNHDPEVFYRELRAAKNQRVAWNLRETTASDISVAAFVPESGQLPRLAVALLLPYKDMAVHDRGRLTERVLDLASRMAEATKAAPLRITTVSRKLGS